MAIPLVHKRKRKRPNGNAEINERASSANRHRIAKELKTAVGALMTNAAKKRVETFVSEEGFARRERGKRKQGKHRKGDDEASDEFRAH